MSQDHEQSLEAAHRVATEGLGDVDEGDAYAASDEEVVTTRGGGRGRWLTELADVLRGAGLEVQEFDGWERRARGSGGLRAGPQAIIVHHTGSSPRRQGHDEAHELAESHKVAPVCNLFLDRTGTWWVLAAGATNTNGRGGPLGPIPLDDANPRVIGIEAANRGSGEPWPSSMQDSYVKGVAALADHYDIDSNHVYSHFEWAGHTKRGKVDPAGPSRFGSVNSARTWDMNKFRAEVNTARRQQSDVRRIEPPADPTDDGTYVVRPGDSWWSIARRTMGDPKDHWLALADANGGPDRTLMTGAVLTIPTAAGATGGAASRATAPPDFPGEAKRGTQGPVVLAWQEALIAHGVIADTEDNHDGDYGEGMERAVLALQQSWGWSNADGIAGSGTWKRLHADD